MATYKVIRFYKDSWSVNRTLIKTGLTLEQAQAHCYNPETSSTTATSPEATFHTRQFGEWFDGYEEEK
jgi:hypothetical protein